MKKADVQGRGDSWFYTDTVKEHFFKPKNFLKENDREAFEKKSDGVGMVGSPACGDMMRMWIIVDKKTDKIAECKWQTFGSLLPGAKVLLEDYTSKKVEKLTIGDKIIDGEGKINFVEEVLVKNYDKKILNIQLSTSKFYNFTLTPNHPVPCIKRKKVALVQRQSGKRWSEIAEGKIDDSETIVIPAAELEEGDFLLFQVPTLTNDYLKLDEDICVLLGYYVSDGSSPSKNRIIFYFGLNEKEQVDEIAKICERREWQHVIYKRNTENVVCVQISEPVIANVLRKHGGLPSKKKFSKEIMLLPPEKQERIIDAYVAGDGWITKQNPDWNPQYFISTSKEKIAYQLQIMLGRTGIFAPIHKRESREFILRGKKYRNSGEYNLIFKKEKKQSRIKHHKKEMSFLIPIQKIESYNYKGKIYDLGIVYEPKTYRVNGISLHNCASAIASTSMLSLMVTEKGGMKVDEALKIKPQDVVKRLGDLPTRKFHCSVLGDKALRAAINDYFKKSKQDNRVLKEGVKIIDKVLRITDQDIKEAILHGARSFEDVQKKTKVGVKDKSCIPEVKQLIRYYTEKYYG